MVNFNGYDSFPVQRWFRYREGYSLGIAKKFIAENGDGGTVADPFCGSGTTLLAAQQEKFPSLGVEINPVFALLSEVKCRAHEKDVIAEMNKIEREIRFEKRDAQTRETPFPLAKKVFNAEILQALLQFRERLDGVSNPQTRDALRVAWLSIIEESSNIRKEGNGIKYRFVKRTPSGYRREPQEIWETKNFPINRFNFVKNLLCDKVAILATDMAKDGHAPRAPAQVIGGDCLREIEQWDGRISAAIFSPPYCNCFDYFEIHKVELWLGGYVECRSGLRSLRRGGFRSNPNTGLNRPRDALFEEVESVIGKLLDRPLWSRRIPQVVRGYFSDTARLLAALRAKIKKGGRVGMIIGNSAYAGVIVPTDLLVARIAERQGFKVEHVWICRRLTTSSQQQNGLRHLREYLRESMVVVRRDD